MKSMKFILFIAIGFFVLAMVYMWKEAKLGPANMQMDAVEKTSAVESEVVAPAQPEVETIPKPKSSRNIKEVEELFAELEKHPRDVREKQDIESEIMAQTQNLMNRKIRRK